MRSPAVRIPFDFVMTFVRRTVSVAVAVVAVAVGAVPAHAAAPEPVEVAPYVTVRGDALPASDAVGTAGDPAIGEAMPVLTGVGPDGKKVRLAGTGRPRIVGYFAHWCSHCQKMMPMIAGLQRDGKLRGVDVQAVSTYTDPAKDNAPAADWFRREGWKGPVLVDDADHAAFAAAGAQSLSFLVFVDRTGKVRGRFTPDLTATQVVDHAAALRARRPLFAAAPTTTTVR